jgi:hypothetical protein
MQVSNTAHAVSHPASDAILAAVQLVRDVAPGFEWDFIPGHWLKYTRLLALPVPDKVVHTDPL